MIEKFRKLLGLQHKADLGNVIANGAVIVDVRSPREYGQGHVKGSVNIPLTSLPHQLPKLRKDTPVIICCASGARAGAAKAMLDANGYKEVYNAGSWINLKKFEQ